MIRVTYMATDSLNALLAVRVMGSPTPMLQPM